MYLTLGRAKIYYHQVGNGEPLVMLHGVPDSADLWQFVQPALAEKFQTFAFDLPGFHRSQIPATFNYSLDGYANTIDELLNAANIEHPVTLVAHDWGAIFAMAFACKHPHRVKAIVCGSFPFNQNYRWHAWARIWRTPLLGELAMLAMNRPLFSWELKRGSMKLSDHYIRTVYDQKVNRWSVKQHVLRLYRSATPQRFLSWQSRLRDLKQHCPIRLIWGKQDHYVPSHCAHMIPHHDLTLVDHCGHWVPVEAPKSYIDAVLDY